MSTGAGATGAGQRALQSLGYVPVLHPELLALYPVLGLYAHNAGKLPMSFLARPAAFMALGALLLWVLLSLLLRNIHRAGLVTSLLVFSAFSGWGVWASLMEAALPIASGLHASVFMAAYAAIVTGCVLLLVRYRPRVGQGASTRKGVAVFVAAACVIGAAAWALLGPVLPRGGDWMMAAYLGIVVAVYMLLLAFRGDCRQATRTLNWFAFVLILLTAGNIALRRHEEPAIAIPPLEEAASRTVRSATPESPYPDIYLIVLEGYARADVLRTTYGYNNLPFLDAMRAKGFQVADRSFANYPVSLAAVGSMLNLDYLHALIGPETSADAGLPSLVHAYTENRAFQFLRSRGYRIVAFSPREDALEPCPPMADVALKPPFAVSEFEQVLLRNCAFAPMLDSAYYWRHGVSGYWLNAFSRQRVRYIVSNIASAAGDAPQPCLVFAYLLVPEQPFLFTHGGWWAKPVGFSLRGEPVRATWRQYFEGYVEQLHYVNRRLLEISDALTASSTRPSVVLIVSSRGPGFEPASAHGDMAALRDRFPNLVMVRFPDASGADAARLPQNISLVNVLRFTFDRVFGASFGLLPDEAFVSSDRSPLDVKPLAVSELSK